MLIHKRGSVGIKHFNDFEAFIEYSNDMDDIYQNIEECNPTKKILIALIVLIVGMFINKKLNQIVTELFIRSRKLNISLVFITQSYFAVPKNTRLNITHYFIMKIPDKREPQQITLNHSSDTDFQNYMNLYKKNILQNHILFWWLKLFLHQIILYVLERIF